MKTKLMLLTFFFALAVAAVAAPPKPTPYGYQKQSGGIRFEEDQPIRNVYYVNQDNTIKKFKQFEKSLISISKGNVTPIPNFTRDELYFLAATYLYCATKNGSCPLIVESLYELDLVNSYVNKRPQCPNLTTFWNLWVEADMEKRIQYDLKIGLRKKMDEFNKDRRPGYLRCVDTIRKDLVLLNNPRAFSARYSTNSIYRSSVTKASKLIQLVKKKVNNIFFSVGVEDKASKSSKQK